MPGKKAPAMTQQRLLALAAEVTRQTLAAYLGKSYGGARDLYAALGYPLTLAWKEYYARYQRQDIAKAIIDAPVQASWRDFPEVYEVVDQETALDQDTPFELAWSRLADKMKLQNVLTRLDRLASLGQYAVLLMGFNDGGQLSEVVASAKQLLYLMPYSENSATIQTSDTNEKSARFGLPLAYQVSLAVGTNTMQKLVHYSRVIHVAEDLLENNVKGAPRLEAVYNRLQDIELISGGSAEMFWRGAFPGMSFEKDPTASTISTADREKIVEQVETYVHTQSRYMLWEGIKTNQLAVQVADPSNHISVQLDLIAAATGIPKRILMGSERGDLASTQDEKHWLQRVDDRRHQYCEPCIVRPFIDQLIVLGVLPQPKNEYTVEWSDLMASTDKEKADVAVLNSQALANYTNAIGADTIITPEQFLREVMQFNDDQITRILQAVEEVMADANDDEPVPSDGEQPVIEEPAVPEEVTA